MAEEPRNTGAHLVYGELKRRILSLDLKPGERIYEPAMATALQVSRTPLREAIRRLISESLLEQLPTGGVLVPELDEKVISELYDVRAALESLMAREACANATAADLEELRGILARNAAMVEFADEAMKYGVALHAAIARIAGNSWAQRFHGQIASQVERYRYFTNNAPERRDEALANHRLLVEAIASKDEEKAAKVAFDHVIGARDETLRVISASGLAVE
ncbi:GntR family transcriptional regulator [Paenarthrobacter aurescens]|uniref:GntR family transcriptional regulator n=1 Tax=Paenarthrobacter aurescens TaxID=43663 RepID=A0A4Y3NDV0_PAEAU|nr:GntR family transcriptional regulator [Paenarthrobacter aurescens]MDO6144972.1 GntR family transcriptional regulator [Paenarthrobacter aurescens]MDO6148817.1 GntR family transcriptional regulator [Paenarthrobacter aurescens]MDO6160063.1 GntR family transcriptional regulator [Paenarthrobacter aurescens]MDO6163922.1 GntR family transcriptional regulator [Paenarthrobacter aurescens]GEB17366.1 GntR family transcriptional regulator [Paenarthrobacter aurescens]